MNIYQINENIKQLFELFEVGEISEEEFAQATNQLEMMMNEKIDNTITYIKSLKANVEAIKSEEKALKERRQAKENLIDRLTENIKSYMEIEGKNKFENARHSVSFRKTPEKVVISDLEGLTIWSEENYQELFKTEYKPILSRIKTLVKEGKEVPGVKLESGETLLIK